MPKNYYRELCEADFADFIDARVEPSPTGRVGSEALYNAYVEYREAVPFAVTRFPPPPMTLSMFGRLSGENLIKSRTTAGNILLGIRLK